MKDFIRKYLWQIVDLLTFGLGIYLFVDSLLNYKDDEAIAAFLIVLGFLIDKWRKEGILDDLLKKYGINSKSKSTKSNNNIIGILLTCVIVGFASYQSNIKDEIESEISDIEYRIDDIESVVEDY